MAEKNKGNERSEEKGEKGEKKITWWFMFVSSTNLMHLSNLEQKNPSSAD